MLKKYHRSLIVKALRVISNESNVRLNTHLSPSKAKKKNQGLETIFEDQEI
jgi:hypothetical protein